MKVGTGRETGTESERQRIRESERKRCSESQPILRERDGTLCLPYWSRFSWRHEHQVPLAHSLNRNDVTAPLAYTNKKFCEEPMTPTFLHILQLT